MIVHEYICTDYFFNNLNYNCQSELAIHDTIIILS